MELPIYYMTFDPENFESGIDMIAITENPAIELFAVKFEKQNQSRFKFDQEKQIIAGPVAVPNKPIYRKDEDGKEYYVVFTPETIEAMAEKFNQEHREIKFNLEHDENKLVEGFIKGSWIVEDPDNDKSKYYGFTDLPVKTFFIEAKITDKQQWQEINKAEFIGFSLEGLLGLQKLELSQIIDTKQINQTNMKKTKLKFLAKRMSAKKKFNTSTKKFESQLVVSEDEDILVVDETLAEGSAVEIVTEDGTLADAPTGDYEIASEEVVVSVVDGEVAEVVEMAPEEVVEEDEEFEREDPETDEDREDPRADEDEDAEVAMAEDEDVEEVATEMAEMITKMAELETRIEEIENMVKDDEDKEKFSKKNKFNNQTLTEKIELLKRL